MKEATGDLWTWAQDANALCITTNGTIKRNGECVMGRGIALQAKERIPPIAKALGDSLAKHGNHVQKIWTVACTSALPGDDRARIYDLIAFPVKHQWEQPADIQLIERSAYELVELTEKMKWESVVLPRPGCGNGGLRWKTVKPVIESILDDRFTVVEWA